MNDVAKQFRYFLRTDEAISDLAARHVDVYALQTYDAEIERLQAALAEILLVPPYAGEEGLSRCLTVAAAALEGK